METDIWVEKYRPKTFDDVIGDNVNTIKDAIKNPAQMPHFLFFGTPGTGKTTIAQIIIKQLKADCLKTNASDENSIDYVRDKIKSFVSSMRINTDVPKIVLLDEGDYISTNGQAALRGLMEQFHQNARFIITCNRGDKIIDAIKSRCVPIEFKLPAKKDILERLKYICENEKIKYEEDALKKIINLHYPDIRGCINKLQRICLNKTELTLKDISSDDEIFEKLWLKINEGSRGVDEARQEWIKLNLDLDYILKFVFEKIFKSDKEKRIDLLISLAETSYRMGLATDKEIVFYGGMLNLWRI